VRRSHNIDYRGNTRDRRKRRAWLLATFGDGKFVRCHWCAKRMRTTFEVDRYPHPQGRYTRDNIVPACRRCNRGRRRTRCYVPETSISTSGMRLALRVTK